MFTTVGVTAFAMFLNVVASTGPLSGALFAAGVESVCAAERVVMSSRDASTIPTMTDASTINSP
jgi:hypothetical protein